MLRRVTIVRTDVSAEPSAYMIRVTRIGELGTTLAVTSNRRTLRNILEDGILHSHRRENHKSYKTAHNHCCEYIRTSRSKQFNGCCASVLLLVLAFRRLCPSVQNQARALPSRKPSSFLGKSGPSIKS
jgi:hypothetical protein